METNNEMTTMEQVPYGGSSRMLVSSAISASSDNQCFRRSRPKPIPPPLVLQNDVNSLLTEFAIIATSPRSPLMQKNLPIRKRALSCSSMEAVQSPIHTAGILSPPPSSSSVSSSTNEDNETRVSSSSPYPASPFSTYGIGGLCVSNSKSGGNWTHSWPVPVWYCFLKGTKICFTVDSSIWRYAEEVGFQETMRRKAEHEPQTPSFAPYGLKLLNQFCKVSETVHLRFRPMDEQNGATMSHQEPQHDLEVECNSDHPFYAKDKGWSSIQPQLTVERYGIPCRPLEINDVCLPPFHPDASFHSDIFESIRSFDFTPEDTTAVLALSNMAKHKQNTTHLISGVAASPPASPTKKCASDSANTKPKRPMNGFMLFAKQHRVEYTQIYPGKDNRAISVLLGDSWKRMSFEERNNYAQQAKVLAEERKKLFPDCWKRRRSLSTSS